MPGSLLAQISEPEAVEETVSEEPASEEPATESESSTAIDHVRNALEKTVWATAGWFDNLFGDPRAFEETDRSYGVIEAGGEWREFGEVDGIGRVRIKWRLPALEDKLDGKVRLILGRVPDEQIAQDEEDPDGAAQDLDPDQQQWVSGLDSAFVDKKKLRLNAGAGLHYGDSLEPYVKLRARSRWLLNDETALRLRVTPFWQDGDRRFGTRTSLDLDHRLSPDLLMRWTTSGTRDSSTLGTRFFAGMLLYHQIDRIHSMAHRVGVVGETEAEVPDRSYGFFSSLRRRISRDWLFLKIGAGVDWRRETLAQSRRSAVRGQLSLELQFGEDR